MKVIKDLEKKIPNFNSLPESERVLQVVAYLCDTIKVKEEGKNKGDWVETFLKSAGLGPGAPWCASLLCYAFKEVGLTPPSGAAAVINWFKWAKKNKKLRSQPQRSYLCLWLNADGTGHIGIVVKVENNRVFSIEGNTSSGEAGSQRDGDGLFRRNRPASIWHHYIEI